MHLDKFGSLSKSLSKDIIKTFGYVHDLKCMGSMRTMQFAGDAITKNNVRSYNCSAQNIDDPRCFGETFFVLLSGCGLGFSVQNRHISKLPVIKQPTESCRYIIHDSIQGWSQAVDQLIDAYMLGRVKPIFEFTQVRSKDSLLSTTGAKAPGPEPLKKCLQLLDDLLSKIVGRKMRSIEVYDAICIIADAVLAGGIRRAALICLFDKDDKDMIHAKTGEWWIKYPYRARSNNSVLLSRNTTFDEFKAIFDVTRNSGSGEPGFSWSNNFDMLFNPCHEISLNSNQFCNLVTGNVSNLKNKQDFLKRCHAMALMATLQAAYTDFPYLRDKWKETTEREALIGCSLTGIADTRSIPVEWLRAGVKLINEKNELYSKKIGINPAARTTAIKPEGSASCVFGSSSGIHDRHSEAYIRRIEMLKDDSLYKYLQTVMPDLCEDSLSSPNNGIVSIPIKSPPQSVTREKSSAIKLLDRAMRYNKNWIAPGHRSGDNRNNVSLTCYVKEHEWDEVAEYMFKHRYDYSGVALFPYDGGVYKQAPFEEITIEKYNELCKLIGDVNLKDIKESGDFTSRTSVVACSGGTCEII